MGRALKIGISLTAARRAGDWTEPGALIDADYARNQFLFNGSNYASEAAMNTAAGAVKSGITRTFGPYVFGPELCADPGFGSGVDSWVDLTGFEAAGSPSNVGGRLRLTAESGTAYRAGKLMTTVSRRAYLWSLDYVGRSGGTAASASANISNNSTLGGSASKLVVGMGTPQNLSAVGASESTGTYVGAVMSYTGTPYIEFDNQSLKEVYPYQGFAPERLAFKIKGTTPAVASGNKVLATWGEDRETNRVRLVWDASAHLRLIVTASNAEQANLDLGVVNAATAFTVEGTCALNRIAAWLNGGASIGDASAVMPGLGRFWIGRSFTGETWDGTIDRVTVWPRDRVPTDAILTNGDSYSGGAGGVSIGGSIAAIFTTRPVFAIGVGGSVGATQATNLEAVPGTTRGVMVDWDGALGTGAVSLAQSMADYARKWAASSSKRVIFIPPLIRANATTNDNNATAALQAAIAAAYPDNYINAQAILAANATSPGDDADVAAGRVPDSLLQADDTHLTSAAMGYVATAVTNMITAKGW